ncbi:phage integrase family protein [Rhizobium laguerreae]|nr:phage integrase family protein [Rhizobium laguerreae]
MPIAAYLAYRKKHGASTETLRKESYWVAEFWDFLRICGVGIQSVKERDVIKFLDNGAKRASQIRFLRRSDAGVSYLETIDRKRDLVYRFLYVLEHKLQIIRDVITVDGSPKNGTLAFKERVRVSLGVASDNQGDEIRSEIRKAKERTRQARPTPSQEQADKILNAALEWQGELSPATYYLFASLQNKSGARAGGICDLTVSCLTRAVETEVQNLVSKTIPYIAKLACDSFEIEVSRREIVQALRSISERGRKFIFVSVIEKGKPARGLPIPINLSLEILEYIWNERARFLKDWRGTSPTDSDYVFLSQTTARQYKRGSVSKILKSLFDATGVRGSGHRLRATFCEEVVRDLYLREKAKNGSHYDVDTILLLAAEYLGHRDPRTLRPYLNNILKQDAALEGQPVMFSDEDAPKFAVIAQALSEPGPAADKLRTLVIPPQNNGLQK